MDVKPRRVYNSPKRSDQASATARQILEAASACFAERGYPAVTMADVARAAGVSIATVYIHFPGKAAIVLAMADAIVMGPDLSVEQVEREPDVIELMRLAARIIRSLNDRSWLVMDILRSAHGTDPLLADVLKDWQDRHLDAIRRGIGAIDARGGLRAGITRDEAVDAFYALAGSDVYRALVRERGWSPDRYQQWLFALGCRELLGIASSE